MGRENRAAQEEAENIRIQRFEKRKVEVEQLHQEAQLAKKERDARQIIAELRAGTTRRGQDIDRDIAGAKITAATPYQNALSRESAARLTKIMTEVAKTTTGARFKEIFDDIMLKQVGDLFTADEPKIIAAAQTAAASMRGAGAPENEIQEAFNRTVSGSLPPSTKFSVDQLAEIRRRAAAGNL